MSPQFSTSSAQQAPNSPVHHRRAPYALEGRGGGTRLACLSGTAHSNCALDKYQLSAHRRECRSLCQETQPPAPNIAPEAPTPTCHLRHGPTQACSVVSPLRPSDLGAKGSPPIGPCVCVWVRGLAVGHCLLQTISKHPRIVEVQRCAPLSRLSVGLCYGTDRPHPAGPNSADLWP